MWPHIPPGEGPTEASWVAEHQVHRPVSKGVCLPLQHHLPPALNRESDAHWVCKQLKVQGTLTGKTGKLKGGDEIKKKRRSVCLRAPTSLVCAEGAQLRSLDGTALPHRRRH